MNEPVKEQEKPCVSEYHLHHETVHRWRVRVAIILLFFIVFLSFFIYCETDENDDGSPKISAKTQACYRATLEQWAKDEMTKQPNRKLMEEIKNLKYAFVNEDSLNLSLKEVKSAVLASNGLPTTNQWKKISGGKEFKRFYIANLNGENIIIADSDYIENKHPSQYMEIYIKKNGLYKRLLHIEGSTVTIHLMKLGKNSPVFIKTYKSAGGSGWGGNLYLLNKDDILTDVLTIGGWQAGIFYADVVKNANLIVINTKATGTEVNGNSLRERLKQCPDYDEFHFVGPIFDYAAVFKWNGKKFEKVGEFFMDYGEWDK